ncbi:MAG TPA: hypothetical protein VIO36_02090 [Anaerolineaceae bacterium]
MKRFDYRIVLAVLLILGGVVFLLQNLGVVPPLQDYLFALLFAVGGLAFLGVLAADRKQWWAIIPGVVLLDLALIIGLGEATQRGVLRIPDDWIGGVFLLGIGVAFWVVFFTRPEFWWAIIPAGTLSTLGVVAAFGEALPGGGGATLFIGLALTFGLLGLIPVNNQRMGWPFIPAAACLFVALIILASAGNLINYLWPVALILGGGFLLLRAFTKRA